MTAQHSSTRSWTFVDGQSLDSPIANGRAFLYGDGFFETMIFENGKIPLFPFHLSRLEKSCQRLYIKFDEKQIQASLNPLLGELISANVEAARVRLTLSRADSDKGSYGLVNKAPVVVVQARTFEKHITTAHKNLVSAIKTLSDDPLLAGLKHLNRLNYIVAAADITLPENGEVLFCDSRSNIVDCMHHNIFFVKDKKVHTPKLGLCGVRGVMRQIVVEHLCEKTDFDVTVCEINIGDIEQFTECFITNAFVGLVPVNTLNGKAFKSFDTSVALNKKLTIFKQKL